MRNAETLAFATTFWSGLMRTFLIVAVVLSAGYSAATSSNASEQAGGQGPQLIGHWPLQSDGNDVVGKGLTSRPIGLTFEKVGPTGKVSSSAVFDGRSSVIEVNVPEDSVTGTSPFSVAAWIHPSESVDDVPGDIISRYDSATRTGFHFGLYSHHGVTNSQSNFRQLHFGIDQDRREPKFRDHGRLGNAVYIFSLCVHADRLYASTCHAGAGEAGRVYRYEGGEQWTDLGSPDQANAVSAMASYNGSLYVASSKYRLAGSSLAESENPVFGGKIYRLDEEGNWIHCGTLSAETQAVASLIEYRGSLYASSLYKPAGFFRYDGGTKWTALDTPDGKRVEATTVYNGSLYATCYDEGLVFRYDGEKWHPAGRIPEATQTYGFAVHEGSLFVSEWPKAHVYRYLGGTEWQDAGRLGQELETMPLVVYNGRMYGGTLPLGEVYRYDGETDWTQIEQVDRTPDVKFRRAWSMAVFQGRLFVGTLPSGRVLSLEVGRNATVDTALSAEWHHVAAVRSDDRLIVYVDGKRASESVPMTASEFDLTVKSPLKIGFGAQDYFQGRMADVRLYRGALSDADVQQLSGR
jgi:hypothetical protein